MRNNSKVSPKTRWQGERRASARIRSVFKLDLVIGDMDKNIDIRYIGIIYISMSIFIGVSNIDNRYIGFR